MHGAGDPPPQRLKTARSRGAPPLPLQLQPHSVPSRLPTPVSPRPDYRPDSRLPSRLPSTPVDSRAPVPSRPIPFPGDRVYL